MWLLIFFITPIVEMYLLIEVGGYIGAWPTIALVMITAVIGVTLLRIQGLNTLTRGLGRLQDGQLPAREMVEGLLLAVAGALLLTPGFVSDLAGFILLSPLLRAAIADRVLARVQVVEGPLYGTGAFYQGSPRSPGSAAPSGGEAIEGEFVPVEEPAGDPAGEGRGKAD